MRIVLINENSQASKNSIIFNALEKVAKKYNHEVINLGMKDIEDKPLTYVEVGLMGAILLNSGACDFVVSGCGTGQGAMLALNSFPNVFCGLIYDPTSAYLFSQINGGNAVSIPYAYQFGWGAELNLENLFNELFKSEAMGGYPRERAEAERNNKNILDKVKYVTTSNILDILKKIDQDLLKHVVSNQVFMEVMEKYASDRKVLEVIVDAK